METLPREVRPKEIAKRLSKPSLYALSYALPEFEEFRPDTDDLVGLAIIEGEVNVLKWLLSTGLSLPNGAMMLAVKSNKPFHMVKYLVLQGVSIDE